MLKRPNPYRKTRVAGTLDDLMFDMDKRRHTSFRFQNYQNFITDRPGKLVSFLCSLSYSGYYTAFCMPFCVLSWSNYLLLLFSHY